MARSSQTPDNEEQLQDLSSSGGLLLSASNKDLDGDEMDDDNTDERVAPAMLRSTAIATSISELDSWGSREADGFGALNFNALVEQSEISDDPVRMYLREIGRVDLLTAQDERFLARGMEISIRLSDVQSEMAAETGRMPSAADTTLELLTRLGAQHEAAQAIAN